MLKYCQLWDKQVCGIRFQLYQQSSDAFSCFQACCISVSSIQLSYMYHISTQLAICSSQFSMVLYHKQQNLCRRKFSCIFYGLQSFSLLILYKCHFECQYTYTQKVVFMLINSKTAKRTMKIFSCITFVVYGIVQMATQKRFSQFYFQGLLVSLLKLRTSKVTKKSTKFLPFKITMQLSTYNIV